MYLISAHGFRSALICQGPENFGSHLFLHDSRVDVQSLMMNDVILPQHPEPSSLLLSSQKTSACDLHYYYQVAYLVSYSQPCI